MRHFSKSVVHITSKWSNHHGFGERSRFVQKQYIENCGLCSESSLRKCRGHFQWMEYGTANRFRKCIDSNVRGSPVGDQGILPNVSRFNCSTSVFLNYRTIFVNVDSIRKDTVSVIYRLKFTVSIKRWDVPRQWAGSRCVPTR